MSDIRRTHGSGNQVRCLRDDHDPWREILRAREKAHAKHGVNSIESIPADSSKWLAILVEEVGELANTLTYDGPTQNRRAEVIDILAVASALLAAIDSQNEPTPLDDLI